MTTLSRPPIIEQTGILQMAPVKRENGAMNHCESYDSGIHTTDDMLMGGLVHGVNEDGIDNKLKGFKVTIARFDAVLVAEEVEGVCETRKEMGRPARMALWSPIVAARAPSCWHGPNFPGCNAINRREEWKCSFRNWES